MGSLPWQLDLGVGSIPSGWKYFLDDGSNRPIDDERIWVELISFSKSRLQSSTTGRLGPIGPWCKAALLSVHNQLFTGSSASTCESLNVSLTCEWRRRKSSNLISTEREGNSSISQMNALSVKKQLCSAAVKTLTNKKPKKTDSTLTARLLLLSPTASQCGPPVSDKVGG